MKNSEFWSVDMGVGMGPLILGTEFDAILDALRENRIDTDRSLRDRSGKLPLPELNLELLFSTAIPCTLVRIDVSDERLRFGSLTVIGKRAHEIVGLFKVPRKELLWCNVDNEDDSSALDASQNTTSNSRELLARGTIWITGVGLGLKLCDGLVETVHLCDPINSPRSGTGTWTKEQQRLSEVREIPPASLVPIKRNRNSVSFLSVLIHLALAAAIGTLVWSALQLQQQWDAAIEVPAKVIATDPPPPHPLPDLITVDFKDSNGLEHRHTLGHLQFLVTPKLGDEVNIRFLQNSPKTVLGPVAAQNVGFEMALPYGIGILAIYSCLQLTLFGRWKFRRRRT